MASGSRRSRNKEEYVFIDGKALRADEAVRIHVDDVAVPGQQEAMANQGPVEDSGLGASARKKRQGRASTVKKSLKELQEDDAFALRDDAGTARPYGHAGLFEADRRQTCRKCLIFVGILLLLALFSLCISRGYPYTLYSPADIAGSLGSWFYLRGVQFTNSAYYAQAYAAVIAQYPMYIDALDGVAVTLKYILCGALLALSGMLYQNTFRNPIAAPSILGVSNGISIALLILVLQYGVAARSMNDLYIIYSMVGGALVLVLVLLGGRWISGKDNFNVVNILLMGTVISQFLGVVIQWVQNMVFTDTEWTAYYLLQSATGTQTTLTYITLFIGFAVSIVPIVALRFRLNLVSFSSSEIRLMGVNDTALRVIALVCGSIMILVAQINAGQVAMVSLVVPFIVRRVFGSEFRKQLLGNLLIGALVLLICGDFVSYVYIATVSLDLGSVVTILVLPLFVWMLVIQQKSWQ